MKISLFPNDCNKNQDHHFS